jgi:hypothetical protein
VTDIDEPITAGDADLDPELFGVPTGSAPVVSLGNQQERLHRAFFWVSSLSIPASTVITVVAVTHMLGRAELATISAIFAASFVGTVLPIAVQARAAADAAAHGAAARLRWWPIVLGTVVWVVLSPPLAHLLHLPVWAMLSPALALIPSMAVAIGRGEMIGQRRFVAAGVNHLADAGFRVAGGIALAALLGVNGIAIGLVTCEIGAWLVLPRRRQILAGFIHLPSAFGASALMILSVQLDVLIAPRLLGSHAPAYAASALPAKGIYLAMSATAWLAVPGAARCRTLRAVVRPLVEVVGGAAALAAAMTLAAPVIGALLAHATSSRSLLLVLGLGMAVASGNWVLMQVRFARVPRQMWVAPAVAGALTIVVPLVVPTAMGLAVGALVGQAAALAISVVQLGMGLSSMVPASEGSHG